MQIGTETFTKYEESGMHKMLISIKDSLSFTLEIPEASETYNDKFALKLRKSYCKIVDLLDGILPPFSEGKAIRSPKLYMTTNALSLLAIKTERYNIEKVLHDRRTFFSALISLFIRTESGLDWDNFQDSQDFIEWFQQYDSDEKQDILEELKEKKDLLIKFIAMVKEEESIQDRAAFVLSMPKSIIFNNTLECLNRILFDNYDLKLLLTFYDHGNNVKFLKQILSKLKQEQPEQLGDENIDAEDQYLGNLIYQINGRIVDLSSPYHRLIEKFVMLKSFYQQYCVEPVLGSGYENLEQNSEEIEEEDSLGLIFPVLDETLDLYKIFADLENYKRDYSITLNAHKMEKLTTLYKDDLCLLEKFDERFKTGNSIDKFKLTFGNVNSLLSAHYCIEVSDKKLLKQKFIHLKRILLNKKSDYAFSLFDFTPVFQEIENETVLKAISKLQVEFSCSLKKLNLERVYDSELNDDSPIINETSLLERNSEVSESSEGASSDEIVSNSKILKKSIVLCNKVSKYLQDLETKISDLKARDFLSSDFLPDALEESVIHEITDFVSDNLQYREINKLIVFLQELPDLLKQQRKALLNKRLNDIQQEIKTYLNPTSEKVVQIKQKFCSLSTIDNEQFDCTLSGIRLEIDEVKIIETKLKSLDINCDFKLPTEMEFIQVEDTHKLKVRIERRRNKFCEIKGELGLLFDDSLNTYLQKVVFKRLEKDISTRNGFESNSLRLIDKALKKYSNLYLRSILYKLKADLLDVESEKLQDTVTGEEKLKAIENSDYQSIRDIYSKLKEANLNKPELIAYLYDFVNTENKKDAYSAFKDKFITRLHSYDYEMSSQDKKWFERKTTIIIAIFTLGLALGISYAATKITTGKAYLFWEKTHKQEAASKVIECVNDMRMARV